MVNNTAPRNGFSTYEYTNQGYCGQSPAIRDNLQFVPDNGIQLHTSRQFQLCPAVLDLGHILR